MYLGISGKGVYTVSKNQSIIKEQIYSYNRFRIKAVSFFQSIF